MAVAVVIPLICWTLPFDGREEVEWRKEMRDFEHEAHECELTLFFLSSLTLDDLNLWLPRWHFDLSHPHLSRKKVGERGELFDDMDRPNHPVAKVVNGAAYL